MTEEVREELAPVEGQELEVNDQDLNAAFEAGFSGEEVQEAPEPVAEEPKPEEVKEPEKEVEAAPPTPEELIAQAKAEIYKELGKVRDGMAGKWGEVNQRMQQMLTQQQSSGGSGVKLSATNMKRLSADFPEIAEMLAEDLSEALGGFSAPAPQMDQSVIDQRVSEKITEVEDRMKKDLEKFKLSTIHADWESVVQRDEFKTWLGSQPLEYQESINQSWDAREIATAISAFKDESQKAQQQAQQRKSRLEAAVTPTQATQSAPAPDATDDFLAGWKAVRG